MARLLKGTVTDDLTVRGDLVPSTPLSHRNMIINGAMQISQRGDATGITNAGSGYYGPDRYKFNEDGTMTAVVSITKETLTADPAFLDGFNSAYKIDVTTDDASVASDCFVRLTQRFEKNNLAQLAKGTASAKKCTLSFWVKATINGVNVVEFFDQVNTRGVSATYTISSSDTWEYKTVTFPADTSTGDPFGTGAGLAAEINFVLQAGTNYTSGTLATAWADEVAANRAVGHACNHFSSTSNNFHLTGVQLELGENATPFEHRSYGDELRRCHRYFQLRAKSTGSNDNMLCNGFNTSTTGFNVQFMLVEPMRSVFTIENDTGTNYFQWNDPGTKNIDNLAGIQHQAPTSDNGEYITANCYSPGSSGYTSGAAGKLTYSSNATSGDYFGFTAEL